MIALPRSTIGVESCSYMAITLRRNTLTKLFALTLLLAGSFLLFSLSETTPSSISEYKGYNVIERVTGLKNLNAQKYKSLQRRMGRDSRPDILDDLISAGVSNFWEQFQVPL